MKQYLKLLQDIKDYGTEKPAARENMPGTTSLFGYQNKYDLADGFPLLTTKEIKFEHIVTELLWFLRGDTNIKYLVDNNCNIWNEDAYNYYVKEVEKNKEGEPMPLSRFIELIKGNTEEVDVLTNWFPRYKLGDCGHQYGKTWRKWEKGPYKVIGHSGRQNEWGVEIIDQIQNLIHNLTNSPQSRRHILTSIDPTHDDDLALYWCHALTQFNCRPIQYGSTHPHLIKYDLKPSEVQQFVKDNDFPTHYLDCQMYQRSADVFLGVPYNIASYALLTEILCKICNMLPGEFTHTFGDVHIYDNHKEQVDKLLKRTPSKLPQLKFEWGFSHHMVQWGVGDVWGTSEMLETLQPEWFTLENYNPQEKIKAKLSTGLK